MVSIATCGVIGQVTGQPRLSSHARLYTEVINPGIRGGEAVSRFYSVFVHDVLAKHDAHGDAYHSVPNTTQQGYPQLPD